VISSNADPDFVLGEGSMSEEKEPTSPSLDLAFDRVKGVLYDQKHMAAEYSTRIATLFSVATAVLGIGLPIGLSKLSTPFNPAWTVHFVLAMVAILFYLIVVAVTVYGFWLRPFDTMDDPIKIRKEFWDLSPSEFKVQILAHIENAYTQNATNLKRRAYATQSLIVLVSIQTTILLFALVFALF
jgi:hypothetical protein